MGFVPKDLEYSESPRVVAGNEPVQCCWTQEAAVPLPARQAIF